MYIRTGSTKDIFYTHATSLCAYVYVHVIPVLTHTVLGSSTLQIKLRTTQYAEGTCQVHFFLVLSTMNICMSAEKYSAHQNAKKTIALMDRNFPTGLMGLSRCETAL